MTSPLSQLTEDQREQLLEWMENHSAADVVKMVAAPVPEGFGIRTHATSLRRYYARHRLNTLADEGSLATEMLQSAASAGDFDAATTAALRQIAFQITNSPGFGPSQFKAVSRWILRLRDQEQQAEALAIARERLTLKREEFEFNAARKAIIHHAEIAEIIANPQTDNEDKIRAARDAIFGTSPLPGTMGVTPVPSGVPPEAHPSSSTRIFTL